MTIILTSQKLGGESGNRTPWYPEGGQIYSLLQSPMLLILHDISLVLSCRFAKNVANTGERVAVISDSVGRTLTVE